MGHARRATRWLGAYWALLTAPLLALLLGPRPPGRGFWTDFAIALGFAGSAMLAMQFLLTARFRRATAPFGIDIVFYFHRYAALVAVLLIGVHTAVLLVQDPGLVDRLVSAAPDRAVLSGVLGAVLIVVVAVTSIWRKTMRLHYDGWRRIHVLLSCGAMAAALYHMFATGYYTSSPWKSALWSAILASWVAVVAGVRLVKPLQLLHRPWRVASVQRERGDAWTLTFEPPPGVELRFEPGQFVWLSLRASPLAMREHPFSIASSASESRRIALTIKELGDFTRTIGSVRPGELAYLDGPHGAFSIDRLEWASCLFVAGGIGIAPILCMLRTLADRGEHRPIVLVYGTSTWERTTCREELAALAERLPLRVVHVLEEPHEGFTGERGRPTRAVLERHLPAERAALQCLICGPTPMIDSVERDLHALGIPRSNLHSEIFDLV